MAELTEEQKEFMAAQETAKMEAAGVDVDKKGPISFFHGKSDKDYQGENPPVILILATLKVKKRTLFHFRGACTLIQADFLVKKMGSRHQRVGLKIPFLS